jgi:allantoinase
MAPMTSEPRRDLVGYGPNPPDPQWPGGARLAVNFVINVEEGSERSHAEGDGRSESGLTEVPTSPVAEGRRDLAAESMFEYGARVGIWRLLRIFGQRQLPFTAFACALALERNPELAGALGDLDHDVCCHGWRWIEHWLLDEDEERRQIARAVGSLQQSLGDRPLGWYCRYGPSVVTRRLLVEEGGFLYDSDAYADELPYWCRVDGKPHLIVPYSLTNNDTKFPRGGFATADDYFTFMKDAFDLLYEEGADQPKMMSVGLHPRIIGHPARAAGLIRFLDYVAARPEVWICRRLDIARHWHAHHAMTSESGPR